MHQPISKGLVALTLCVRVCATIRIGISGLQVRGGGSIEPPKSGGGGFSEKGSIDRHHQSVLMSSS